MNRIITLLAIVFSFTVSAKGENYFGCVGKNKPELGFIIERYDSGQFRSTLLVLLPLSWSSLELIYEDNHVIELKGDGGAVDPLKGDIEINKAIYNKDLRELQLEFRMGSKSFVFKLSCVNTNEEFEEIWNNR